MVKDLSPIEHKGKPMISRNSSLPGFLALVKKDFEVTIENGLPNIKGRKVSSEEENPIDKTIHVESLVIMVSSVLGKLTR